MDSSTYDEVTEALMRIEADPEVRVGIITGAGERAFSAGADLKEMHSQQSDDQPWTPWRGDERWDLGLTMSKPLIAAIDGYAVAGGLELALFCDIRIATPGSQFGAPEVKWNLLHGFGALRLPAVVGIGNAMMLLLSGEFIDAEEALRIGLINRIVDPAALMEEAQRTRLDHRLPRPRRVGDDQRAGAAWPRDAPRAKPPSLPLLHGGARGYRRAAEAHW